MSYPSICALSQRPQLTHNPLSSPYGERERSVPVMIVVAGPSGSGKSSNFPIQSMSVPYFSVDDWCAQREGSYHGISPETRRRGGELCEAFVREQIEKRESFAVETTLRGVHAIE